MRGLIVFELKLKLSELDQDLLALGPEDHMPQLLDHQLQMFDPLASRVQLIGLLREGLSMRLELCFKAQRSRSWYLKEAGSLAHALKNAAHQVCIGTAFNMDQSTSGKLDMNRTSTMHVLRSR